MEQFIHEVSPVRGQWLIDSEQDFCDGAKASSFLSPGVSSPSSLLSSPSYCDSPSWIEEADKFNWSNLETFSDYILPESQNLGSDCLLPDVSEHDGGILTSQTKTFNQEPIHQPLGNKKPKIQIKLKKVKKNVYKLEEKQEIVFDKILYASEDKFTPSFPPSPKQQSFVQIDSTNPIVDSLQDGDAYNILDFDFNSLEVIDDPSSSTNPLYDVSDMTLKELVNSDGHEFLEQFIDGFVKDVEPKEEIKVMEFEEPVLMDQIEEIKEPVLMNEIEEIEEPVLMLQIEESTSDDSLSPSTSTSGAKTRKKREPRRTRSPDSRHSRKKEQNKQAALRYRSKKRHQDSDLLQTLREAEEKNAELKDTYSNLRKELQFVKKLMREAFVIKGLVSADAFKSKKKVKLPT